MKLAVAALLVLANSLLASGAQHYSAKGMVLSVDHAHNTFTASCQAIPGFMEAMSMPFEVRDPAELNGLIPGNIVDFTLVVDSRTSYAEHLKLHPYLSAEPDPWAARELKLLTTLTSKSKPSTGLLQIGQIVPNFTLTDQAHQQISLRQFTGKVVAVNFIYTSCALPNYCFRMANNFGVLQRKFRDQLGRDLVLLTVSFDPQRDSPEVLAHYAQTWKADPKSWHFLTGPMPAVRQVTGMFGMAFFPDEGLMNHSLHTALIDRDGKLVANIEGNQFTADQLADLVKATLGEVQKP